MSESKTKSQYNIPLAGLEKWLDETVNKQTALQLPAGAKKWIADNAWWIVLIGGVLSLWSAWSFWQLGHAVSNLTRFVNSYAGTDVAQDLGVMWYLALAAIAVQAVLMLMAFTPLKEHKKTGWNLLFYSSLVSLVVGIVYLFVPGYGFGGLLGTVIGAAIGWFFLFQVRSHFVK